MGWVLAEPSRATRAVTQCRRLSSKCVGSRGDSSEEERHSHAMMVSGGLTCCADTESELREISSYCNRKTQALAHSCLVPACRLISCSGQQQQQQQRLPSLVAEATSILLSNSLILSLGNCSAFACFEFVQQQWSLSLTELQKSCCARSFIRARGLSVFICSTFFEALISTARPESSLKSSGC
ncbi:unnamed protein product [Gongylonema pulchrum]|uniref:Uncharacterized protein n=1 Tax=Gongylonema pulchrum TaxID=637853 RepID=A0A183DEP2_9BILA|nr:unnamed protein product [Gongylonema pulchrum]